MAIDYSQLAIPKGEPRVIRRRDKRLSLAQLERQCRTEVRKRDKGKCVVPGCRERAVHLHHIVYRSHGGKWRTENICSLCQGHHGLVHAGRIQINGNANDELIITGTKADLAFKL